MTLRVTGGIVATGGVGSKGGTIVATYTYEDWINQYSNKIYVETTGNDTTGNGSSGNPYATLEKAVTIAADDTAIVIGPGTFDATVNATSEGSGFLSDNDKPLHFFGTPGQTIIEDTGAATRDYHMIGTTNISTTIQGIIFDYSPTGKSAPYSRAIFSVNAITAVRGTIRNCVFNVTDATQSASLIYNNNGNSHFIVKNCSFTVPTWLNSWSSSDQPTQIFKDSAFVTAIAATDMVTKTNLVDGVTFDGNYSITAGGSDATHGVYSGELSWSSPTAPPSIASSTPVTGHNFISWLPTDEELEAMYRDAATGTEYDLGVVTSVDRVTVGSNQSLKQAGVDTVITPNTPLTNYTISLWHTNTYNTSTSGGWWGRQLRVGSEWFTVYRAGNGGGDMIYSPNASSTRYQSTNSLTAYNGVHHMVWVRSGTTCTVYVNGVLEGSFSGAPIPSASLTSITLDNNLASYLNAAYSRINFALFDGAMDASDVSTLYSVGVDAMSDRTSY